MARILRKSAHVLASSRISDHWKEKVLPRYSIRLIGTSLGLFIGLLVCLSPFGAAIFISNSQAWDFDGLLYSPLGLGSSTLFAIAYAYLRNARN